MTEKYILKLELRYRSVNKDVDHYVCPKIVVGIYDDWETAAREGNKVVKDHLSRYFEVRGDDLFMKRYAFGFKNNLVSNTCYTRGKPTYFFTIEKIVISDDVVGFVENAIKEYDDYKEWEEKYGTDKF